MIKKTVFEMCTLINNYFMIYFLYVQMYALSESIFPMHVQV